MAKAIFTDGINQVHFVNGMVRLNMYTLEPQGESGSEPKQIDAGTIVLTIPGFFEGLGAMQQLADKLIENGVVQREESQH
ncbi:MAG: hypothetical protein IJT59_03945 [Desulfovibrionaceae bacterium]|nr:hypothetical protein [Desulfovibrionaceae bacterium]